VFCLLIMLRLIIIILLLLISLLTVVKAPTYHLWLLAVLVGEYGILFIGLTILVLLSGFLPSRYLWQGTALGVLAMVLFLYPIISAYLIGKKLDSDIHQVFRPGKSISNKPLKPFSFIKLFKPDPKLKYQTFKYVLYADTSLTLDYYPAAIKGKRPCVMVIHGGSWSSGDSRQLPELNAVLSKAGYQVVSVNYRLSPKWQSPAPLQDVSAALTYLHQHAEELKVDTSNIVLLGRSAGAQIALLAAYTIKQQGIKGVIDFYGPADMVWGYGLPASKLVMDSRRVMANYLGGYYPKVSQQYSKSSPIEFVNGQTVPTLMIHGANDVLVAYGHSARLSRKLTQNHVPFYWLKLPWATHGFDYHLNGPGGQLSTYAVLQFLRSIAQ
jgi:acetyl esterase/lipase